jgi:hypothetical protein
MTTSAVARRQPPPSGEGRRHSWRSSASAVHHVDVVPDGLVATRGLRAPGFALPGRRRIGTWRGRNGKQLISVRRGQPAVRVRLRDSRYDALIIGSNDAEAVAARLTAAVAGR